MKLTDSEKAICLACGEENREFREAIKKQKPLPFKNVHPGEHLREVKKK